MSVNGSDIDDSISVFKLS